MRFERVVWVVLDSVGIGALPDAADYGDTGPCGAYVERLLQTPEFLEWEKGALADVGP